MVNSSSGRSLAREAEGPISETLLIGVIPNYWIALDEAASRSDLVKSIQRDGCKPLLVDGMPLPAR
jgi:hypothetical protein